MFARLDHISRASKVDRRAVSLLESLDNVEGC